LPSTNNIPILTVSIFNSSHFSTTYRTHLSTVSIYLHNSNICSIDLSAVPYNIPMQLFIVNINVFVYITALIYLQHPSIYGPLLVCLQYPSIRYLSLQYLSIYTSVSIYLWKVSIYLQYPTIQCMHEREREERRIL
jgi:hypothetical protein